MRFSIKNLSLTVVLSLSTVPSFAVSLDFVGSSRPILELTADKTTGLNKFYVVYDMSQISEMLVKGVSTAGVSISCYSNLGGGFAENVDFTFTDGVAAVRNPSGDMGYIINDNGSLYYAWVIDYSKHMLELTSAAGADEQQCGSTTLVVDGRGEPIYYYTIDGRRKELDRQIYVYYKNLQWSAESESYLQIDAVEEFSHLQNFNVTPPLYCNSTFDITGDRFLREWGIEKQITSSLVYANGVEMNTSAKQTNAPDDSADADASNMIKNDNEGMGGSAPADFSFRAWVTDAVVHSEWQIAADADFEYIDQRFNEQNLDYTFTEEGTYYVRFVGSNADGTCESYGETYTIGIGSSELKIPNAFTPNDDGINDVWKVAYRSLLSFSCTIFDRYGTQLYHFTDPSQGWDGKYKGKLVKPGVYFYVIEAKGADGRTYKKGGDINIIKSKRYNGVAIPPAQ